MSFLRPLQLFIMGVALAAAGIGLSADAGKEAPIVPPRQGKSETIHLFNGKDLTGWEGYPDLWSVKDGVIVARNTAPLNTAPTS
ncbi:MAG: DUF1080 domain-containing protein [Gemmataceae bacterium]|nr:DUF1080 domain-containing protein [Gemmataceae bacterium]MDW8266529.1 hypothetical protein [Gemmataceae bacterium]